MVKKISIVFLSIIMMGLIVINSLTKVELMEYMIITGYIPVVIIMFFLVGLSLFLIKKKTKIMYLSLVFIILLLISNNVCDQIIDNEYQKVFRSGVKIGTALDRYYKNNQRYPQELDELVPKYIKKMPKVETILDKDDTGPTFSYFTYDNGNKYEIKFESYVYSGIGWRQLE